MKDGSAALKLGFKNFPMDQCGVQKPELKKIARPPRLPGGADDVPAAGTPAETVVLHYWQQARVKDLAGEEYSAFGVSKEAGGVVVQASPAGSAAARDGFRAGDLIQQGNRIKIAVTAGIPRIRYMFGLRPALRAGSLARHGMVMPHQQSPT